MQLDSFVLKCLFLKHFLHTTIIFESTTTNYMEMLGKAWLQALKELKGKDYSSKSYRKFYRVNFLIKFVKGRLCADKNNAPF